jgi:hypothetical protein
MYAGPEKDGTVEVARFIKAAQQMGYTAQESWWSGPYGGGWVVEVDIRPNQRNLVVRLFKGIDDFFAGR